MPCRAATARERYLRYFITFACYGAHLHGDESGSVDRHHNLAGSRMLEPDAQRVLAERREMLQDPYVLDEASRAAVLAAIQRHCAYRGWNLLAAHVRSNRVHTIVEAETPRENHERVQVLRQPRAKPIGQRRTRSETLGTAWKHALAVEGRGRQASSSVRNRRAGPAHGTVRRRRALTDADRSLAVAARHQTPRQFWVLTREMSREKRTPDDVRWIEKASRRV